MYQAPQQHQQQQQQVRMAETGVLYTAAGQPVAITSPMNTSTYESYRSRQSMIIGIILIITGALSIIFNGVAIGFLEVFSFVGHGIWCGVMFIVAGAFGVSAAWKNRCLVIASMVLHTISSALALIMCLLSVVGAIIGHLDDHSVGEMCAVMAVLAVIAGVAATWGSVLGCKVTCCARQTTDAYAMTSGRDQSVILIQQQQQQQPYSDVPQLDPRIITPGVPSAYATAPGQQQQQSMTSSTGAMTSPAGYYSSPPYNPAVVPPPFAASGPPTPSFHDDSDTLPLWKQSSDNRL